MMSSRPLVLTIAVLALASGCVATPDRRGLAAPAPTFRPDAFFLGRQHGDGVLHVALHRPRTTQVEGVGHMDGDMLVLDQHIREQGKPPRDREWRLRPAGMGHWRGTLSDARGPVAVDVQGNTAVIRFRLAGGLDARQWLYLQPDGRTVLNRMVVTKFGLPVARLDETIHRLD